MQSTTTFSYLRSKISEWKANDLLLPSEVSWARFQEVATNDILPVLCEAQDALEAAGLEVSITTLDEETRCLTLYVQDVGLFFSPAEDGMTICFLARRFSGKEQGYESRILYKRAKPEPLRRLVEEALLRLLGPRRAHVVNQ
ncbi:hypothetical protein [Nitrospira defluvii]|uniref:Uncharacterized protein n=1 Tax=Nitrospira defluvii TaxID=330214 RepID=A0ABM8R9L3_9BACT|nr:hypothetical protein [Nitrospira defluvii]CAE6740838.1 conserved hypothetical protein [Nitrospira defluvii]